METTQGLAYYQSDESSVLNSSSALTYGFDALTTDDIQVVGINSTPDPDERHPLTKDVHYTVDLSAQTVTPTAAWSSLSIFSSNSVDTLRVYRSTTTAAIVDFTNGGVLSESDLDSSYKQALYACQEVSENASGISSQATQSVTTGMLQNLAVTNAKIAEGAVTQNKLAYGAVSSSNIDPGAVGTNALTDSGVTTAKLANSSVTYAKVDSATKGAMENNSASGVVTPDVLKYSPFSPRCYGSITFDTTAPTIISGSLNVNTSALNMDQGVSERRIYFTTPLSDTNYVVMAIRYRDDIAAADNAVVVHEKTQTYFALRTADPESTDDRLDFVVFGSTLSS